MHWNGNQIDCKTMLTYAILCTWDFTKHFQSFKLFVILKKRMPSKVVNEKLLICDFKAIYVAHHLVLDITRKMPASRTLPRRWQYDITKTTVTRKF